jgi:L-threonylcarbamoyladenylate synthase
MVSNMKRIKTKIIKIDVENPNNHVIKNIAKEVKKGKIVVYPTETCYGLGTNALNKNSVKRIYKIKKKPTKSNIIVIVPTLRVAKRYGHINKLAEILVKKFMPGPLTLIVKRKKSFPKITNEDFAFRISRSNVALKLAREAKVPLTATSANIHGKPSIYSGKEIIKQFDKKVDIILDAGNLRKIKPSTIVDLTNEKPKIVREGPIDENIILNFLKAR